MILYFTNPVFNNGRNTTVRRGIKWANTNKYATIPIADPFAEKNEDGTDKIIGYATNFICKIKNFKDISEHDIKYEHDPKCHEWFNLLMEMSTIYEDFDMNEIVTILHFDYVEEKN